MRFHVQFLRSLAAMAAVFLMTDALAAAPEPDVPPTAADQYRQGRKLFDEHRYEAAAAAFEKALTQGPDSSRCAQWLGRACGLQAQAANLLSRPGWARRAREAFEKAVALDANNLGARSDLAAYYAAAPGFLGGSPEKARAQIEEIRRRDPYLGQVRAADLLLDNDQAAAAETAYLAAVRVDGRRTEARSRLIYLYNKSNRTAEAFAQCDALLASDSASPFGLYGLGKGAALSGRRATAGEAALKRFLQLPAADAEGPPPARAHCYLGQLATRRGDAKAARAEYETALRLDPGLEEAAQALRELKRND